MGIIRKLFPRRVNVYVATNEEDYFRIANRLRDNGIPFRAKSPFHPNGPSLGYSSRDTQIALYEIYVKPEDEYRATEIIHQREP